MSDGKVEKKVDGMLITLSGDIKVADITAEVVPVNDGKARGDVLRQGIQKLIEAGGKLEIMAAELLYEVQEKEYWKGYSYKTRGGEEKKFESFDDYIDHEVQFGQRKAYYLIQIYKKFVKELAIPMEILRNVQWSKAKEVVGIINKSNWSDLIKLLPKVSVKELQGIVAEISGKTSLKAKEDTPALPESPPKDVSIEITDPEKGAEEPEDMVTLEIKMLKAQSENLNEAMKVAAFEAGSENPGHLLDMIASDFLASRVTSADAPDDRIYAICSRVDRHIQNFERALGVQLEIKGVTTLDTGEAKKDGDS